MHGKPLSSIAAELNNVLTVFAMCTDEVEDDGSNRDAIADMRDALARAVVLTRQLSEAAMHAEATSPPAHLAHAPTVLIVDEDATSRRAVTRAAAERGYHTIDARTPSEALQHLESVSRIDLVVVDTTLESRRFAGRIVERYRNASVLYLGGYLDDEPLRRELPLTDVSLLCRPFTTSILVDRIAQALAKKR